MDAKDFYELNRRRLKELEKEKKKRLATATEKAYRKTPLTRAEISKRYRERHKEQLRESERERRKKYNAEMRSREQTISVRITAEEKEMFSRYCENNGMTINGVLIKFIAECLEKH